MGILKRKTVRFVWRGFFSSFAFPSPFDDEIRPFPGSPFARIRPAVTYRYFLTFSFPYPFWAYAKKASQESRYKFKASFGVWVIEIPTPLYTHLSQINGDIFYYIRIKLSMKYSHKIQTEHTRLWKMQHHYDEHLLHRIRTFYN